MPSVRTSNTTVIGTTIENLLADRPERFIGPRGARVSVYSDAAGADVTYTFRIGQSIKSTGTLPSSFLGQARVPESLVGAGVGLPGEEIVVSVVGGVAADLVTALVVIN